MKAVCLPLTILLVSGSWFGANGGGADQESLPVTVLYEGVHCGSTSSSPQVVRISGENQLETIFRQMGKMRIGVLRESLPEADYSAQELVLVFMGQQRTGGYRLALYQDRAVVSKEGALVTLEWIQPASDDIVAQVLTHPCILLALPKGGYSRILIVDQTGELSLEAALSVP